MTDFNQLSQAAFEGFDGNSFEGNSFDPATSMNYDPSLPMNFSMPRGSRGGQAAQVMKKSPTARPHAAVPVAEFNFIITNNAAIDFNCQLFAWQNSITKYQDQSNFPNIIPTDSQNTLSYTTGSGVANASAAIQGIANGVGGTFTTGNVGFDRDGNLVFYVLNAGALSTLSVACQETPYRALFEWTSSGVLKITRMRINCSNVTQLQQNMTWFKQTILGAKQSQNIPFASAKDPYQQQNTIIDINKPFSITKEHGLQWKILAGATVQVTFNVEMYSHS